MERVENEHKCFVPIVTCLFVILVIHLTLRLFSLNITNDHRNNETPPPTPPTSTFYWGMMTRGVMGCWDWRI